jgi:hypothetical protein
LGEIVDRYTERIHLKHLKRLMGARIPSKGNTTTAPMEMCDGGLIDAASLGF